jgi:hypothetical protein
MGFEELLKSALFVPSLLFLWSLQTPTLAQDLPVAATTPNSPGVVTGTLTKLDLTGKKGEISTDLGTAILFDITKPQLFQDLSLGRRVTIEMDGEGGANKVIGAFMADIFTPPSEQAEDSH